MKKKAYRTPTVEELKMRWQQTLLNGSIGGDVNDPIYQEDP